MDERFFQAMYTAFNDRDLDTALGAMTEDVVWANGLEGGHVHGIDAVRAYWTRQFENIDPRVTPESVALIEDGRVAVDVHQEARDRESGALLVDQRVRHLYTFDSGRVSRFDIDTVDES